MIDAGTAGVLGSTVDPFALRAHAALERQAFALARLQARVEHAAALVPVASERDWHGPAQQAYDLGLAHLRTALVASGSAVDSALAETRRAVASLSSRVG